jgi:hypothetical protein
VGKAEAAMGRLITQELQLVRGEVNHEQLASGGEQPRRLGNRGGGIIEKMQDLVQHDGVGHAIGQRHVEQIAMASLRLGEPRALELHARIGQHVVIEIEAERAFRAGSKQFENAAGAGAEIDEQRERPRPKRLAHGGFDLILRHMKRADRIPLAGMGFEIGLRRFGARLLHAFGAGTVASERQVGSI